jgi:NADH dehydrogenase
MRPSVVFGREDRFLNLFAQLARHLPVIVLASPGARFQPVHVDDVARAIVTSLHDAHTFGQRYDLCGPRVYTLRQLVECVVRTAGLRTVVRLGPSLSCCRRPCSSTCPASS